MFGRNGAWAAAVLVSYTGCAAALATSTDSGSARLLNLQVGDIDTTALPNLLTAPPPAFDPAQRYVIQLDGPMTPQRDARLRAAGVRPGAYLPTNAFIVDLSSVDPAALAQLEFLAWAGTYSDSWKIAPNIGVREYYTPRRLDLAAQGQVVVDVTLFEGRPADALIGELATLGGTVNRVENEGRALCVTATLPAGQLQHLAHVGDVQFVEETPDVRPRNNTDRWIVQSNLNTGDPNVDTPIYTNGIHGEGQVLGHIDGKVSTTHCSFSDTNPIGPTHRKILAYNSSVGADFHGTHTAGTAVGDGGTFTDTRGVAYLSKLVHRDIPSFDETTSYNALILHDTQGARSHTNSWGDDGTTSYNGLCRAVDRFTYDREDSLVLFAVTNQSLLKNPENAKNLLAVGASQDAPGQANFCSGGAGPTSDQRRKPEIYAPGCSINSSYYATSCGTTPSTGTSMACPAVAGAALLARQYYVDGYYPSGAANAADGFSPTAALVKATLLNSAVDMTGIAGYPSNTEGWGRVQLAEALAFPGDVRRLIAYDVRNASGLTTTQVVEYPITVTGNTEKLKVTLVWSEPAASAGASFAAINNLDLEVIPPAASTYRGNVFTGGSSTPGGAADDRNNVEQVHIVSPGAGAWTVRVKATAVNVGLQGYALVITGQVAEPTVCSGDANGDGRTDQGDLDLVLFNFQSTQPPGTNGDVDGNGEVTQDDLDIVLFDFGCGP